MAFLRSSFAVSSTSVWFALSTIWRKQINIGRYSLPASIINSERRNKAISSSEGWEGIIAPRSSPDNNAFNISSMCSTPRLVSACILHLVSFAYVSLTSLIPASICSSSCLWISEKSGLTTPNSNTPVRDSSKTVLRVPPEKEFKA